MLTSVQIAINGELGSILNSPVRAAFVSLSVGTITLIAIVSIKERTLAGLKNTFQQKAPWWIWIGEILGGLYVLINVHLVGQIGTSQTVILVLFGQITGILLVERRDYLVPQRIRLPGFKLLGYLLW